MAEKELNAPEGEQQDTSGETIATEMPSRPNSDPDPEAGADEQAEGETAEPEEQAEPTEDPTESEKDKPKPALDWKEKRRIEETNKRRAAEARATAAEAELAAYRKAAAPAAETALEGQPATPGETPAEIERRAVATARAQIDAENNATKFREATGRVLQAGIANIPDFEQARQEMVANFGDVLNSRPDFFEAITDPDIPNGHDVFYHLAKDPEQTERLLSMPPVKMAIEIARLSDKVAKPATKQISKAPAPVKPVGGAPLASSRLDDENLPMDQWANTYLKQVGAKMR